MYNLRELQNFVSFLEWFSGTIELKISLKNEFEGFYGKASEMWETQVVIELISSDENVCPNIKVVGKRAEDIDYVAQKVMKEIYDWKLK